MKAAVKNAKRNYERKLAKDSKKNPKAFMSYMKKKTSKRVIVGRLNVDNNKLVTDSKEQANILNTLLRVYKTLSTSRVLPGCWQYSRLGYQI